MSIYEEHSVVHFYDLKSILKFKEFILQKTVQAMRAKLQEMNRQTESFLADIEVRLYFQPITAFVHDKS